MWNKKFIIIFIIFINCLNNIKIKDPDSTFFYLEYEGLLRKNLFLYPKNYETINFNLSNKIITYPLVIVLHGGGGSIESIIKLTKGRIIELKEYYKFFLLIPEGYHKQWNDGRYIPSSDAHSKNINDSAYIKYVIDFLIKNYPINKEKIFIFGISNGGMMSFRFACDYPEYIKGFASIAATMPLHLVEKCKYKNKNLNFILIHGTEDPLVPYNGGEVKVFFRKRGNVISAEETISFWSKYNLCSNIPEKIILNKDPSTPTEVYSYKCNNTFIRFYKIIHGGHTWPGGWQYLPQWYIGKTTFNFFAEEEIIKHFLEY